MKIAFICGSLEPGKNGVGDYTRILASELVRQGHQANMIAIYDRNVSDITSEKQTGNYSIEIPVLRIPANISLKQRILVIKKEINAFIPDWVSLQFVPYAFHAKGLPIQLIVILRSLRGKWKWHIMFHELWIGRPELFSLKSSVTRLLQRQIITFLVKQARPEVVHTQLPDFFNKLSTAGASPKELMLFSNIPAAQHLADNNNAKTFVIGFFSQITYCSAIVNFLDVLGNKQILNGKKIKLYFIGGNREKAESIASQYKRNLQFPCDIEVTGRLSEESLSMALHSCHLGITPIPRHALGKSGSLAAFISHKIPVAAPVKSEEYNGKIGFFAKELVESIVTEPGSSIDVFSKSAEKASRLIDPAVICSKFIADIGVAN